MQQTLKQYTKVATPNLDNATKNKDIEELNNTLSLLSISPTPNPSMSLTLSPYIFLNIIKKAKF